ncbi:uncharacterized protein LOC111633440 [Centruroides sculpturatus]|uniref:uncharacterized protein LOC111620487 n=1 Tax=Centruroides sculpturatus TaxID=218467 RepID=UPI000C6D2E67|nr:uncharacterized protein LOC111620487 [Centruroides sculpturatus]XP_023233778.1 uncharacterized protein LOC111633440 [Centruroides sculpturatus]
MPFVMEPLSESSDVIPSEIFENLTSYLFYKYFPTEDAAQKFCHLVGMVPHPDLTNFIPPCPRCGGAMEKKEDSSEKFGYIYRCEKINQREKKRRRTGGFIWRAKCTGAISCAQNTFFEGAKLSAQKVLMIIYSWVKDEPVTLAARECGVAKHTAVDWYNFCREIAEVIVSNDQKQIGGENLRVEVDETFTRRRKYNRGRITKGTQLTIFGAYCRETREMMYWHVENKSRRVLWSHMSRYIAPGSIIVSDSAPQYRGCTTMGFSEHKTVNHSQQGPGRFVNSDDPEAHTQNIEGRHRWLKKSIKSLRTDRSLQSYTCTYVYRTRFLSQLPTESAKYRQFIEHIVAVYPGPGREGLQLKTIGVPVDEDQPPDEPYFDVYLPDEEDPQGDDDPPTSDSTNTFVVDPKDQAEAGTSGLSEA